jgi:DNA-binding MarR family transcriptional regulator
MVSLSRLSLMEATEEASAGRVELWLSLTNAWKRLHRDTEKNLVALGLSIAELHILRILHEGSSPIMTLASETMLTQPAITGIVDRLEERGLVERLRNDEDRRKVSIKITARGEAVRGEGLELHKRFVKDALEWIEEGQTEMLVSLLEK